jgi:SAM-dependent methyltransferase
MSHTWHDIPGVDTTKPNPARIYDYGLGGENNFPVDREHFEKLQRADPDARLVIGANRAFLRRAVRYCLRHGVHQFLDLGSGIPTVGNVHEAAHQVENSARVVYVDNEPVAVTQTRRLLRGIDNAAIVDADLRHPRSVLEAPETQRLLDLSQPVALLLTAVLEWVGDSELSALEHYKSVLAPGSLLVISHLTADTMPDRRRRVERVLGETIMSVRFRSRSEVAALFDGFELVPPGVVYTAQWHSEPYESIVAPERTKFWAGVGRKADGPQ